ncbi:hypothetical protein CHUAL_004002 [Chamberlinius hualienensis]
MDWLHCNHCYAQPKNEDRNNFYVTNCGHLYCTNCVAQANGTCRICKRPCRTLSLSSQLDPTIAAYFKECKNMIEQHNHEINKVMEFQKKHSNRLLHFYIKKSCELSESLSAAKSKITEQEKEIAALKQQTNFLRQKIEMVGERNACVTPFPKPNSTTSISMSLLRGRSTGNGSDSPGSNTSSSIETPKSVKRRLNLISPPENGRIGVPQEIRSTVATDSHIDLRFVNFNRNLNAAETTTRFYSDSLLKTPSLSTTESRKDQSTPIGLTRNYQSTFGLFRTRSGIPSGFNHH